MAGGNKEIKFQSIKYLYFTVFHNFVLQIWKKDTISHSPCTEIEAKKF